MASFPRGHSARVILVRRINVVSVTTQPDAKVRWQLTASDGMTLRGIPAIGRGVAGCITGTNPQNVV
jgi:hypothetical protein